MAQFNGQTSINSEVLEMNAFERGDYGVYRHKRHHRVVIRKQRGYFHVSIFNEDVIIRRVDDLIQLLRVCGHNDIIDNFITE